MHYISRCQGFLTHICNHPMLKWLCRGGMGKDPPWDGGRKCHGWQTGFRRGQRGGVGSGPGPRNGGWSFATGAQSPPPPTMTPDTCKVWLQTLQGLLQLLLCSIAVNRVIDRPGAESIYLAVSPEGKPLSHYGSWRETLKTLCGLKGITDNRPDKMQEDQGHGKPSGTGSVSKAQGKHLCIPPNQEVAKQVHPHLQTLHGLFMCACQRKKYNACINAPWP